MSFIIPYIRKDRVVAVEMRKSGKSYNEILAALKIPKATLSDWFSKEDWSNNIRKKLTETAYQAHSIRMRELGRVRGIHLVKVYDEARREAVEEFELLKYNPLFIAGIMVYWGEGDKATKHTVRLTNTDPEMMRLFLLFLTKVCGIQTEKIGAHVLIYPDLEAQMCLRYWSEKSGLPQENFTKCVTIQGRHKTKRLGYGVGDMYVCSTYFKAKVLKWLELLPQELMNRAYYANI
jgi:hypothetical protein